MALDIRIRFGRAIRRIHEEQGINQEEAAYRCGLHRTYYSGIERGVRNDASPAYNHAIDLEPRAKMIQDLPAANIRAAWRWHSCPAAK